jgi:hypothetical protein
VLSVPPAFCRVAATQSFVYTEPIDVKSHLPAIKPTTSYRLRQVNLGLEFGSVVNEAADVFTSIRAPQHSDIATSAQRYLGKKGRMTVGLGHRLSGTRARVVGPEPTNTTGLPAPVDAPTTSQSEDASSVSASNQASAKARRATK